MTQSQTESREGELGQRERRKWGGAAHAWRMGRTHGTEECTQCLVYILQLLLSVLYSGKYISYNCILCAPFKTYSYCKDLGAGTKKKQDPLFQSQLHPGHPIKASLQKPCSPQHVCVCTHTSLFQIPQQRGSCQEACCVHMASHCPSRHKEKHRWFPNTDVCPEGAQSKAKG